MSAGLSGAMAARGVHREDVVMTLIGSRVEWVLAMLACFRMGAVALPCNPQLRRKDLELRVAAATAGALHRRGALPRRDAGRRPTHRHGRPGADPRRGPPAGAAGRGRRPRPRGPGARSSSPRERPASRAAVLYPQRYLPGQRTQAEHWVGAREGELAWCTAAPGWSKSARNVFVAPWLQRGGGAAPRRALRPRAAPGADRARGRQRALPGADRVPDARQARRAAPDPRRCAAWSRRASR